MPTTIMLEGVGGLVLCLGMAVLGIYFYGRHCRDIGYEEGRCDQYDALGELPEMAEFHEFDQRGDGHQPGRHERTQPRQPTRTALVQEPRPPWYTEVGSAAAQIADEISRDQLPGPARNQPARDSGPGTVMFAAAIPRHGSIGIALEAAGVKPRLGLPATTGEMAAVTDQYIADMTAAETAYREGLAS